MLLREAFKRAHEFPHHLFDLALARPTAASSTRQNSSHLLL
jgi:hypothetical protein